MLSFEGDSHVGWFEGNSEDHEQDKIRRLGPASAELKRIAHRKSKR
jgi:hypothetical protein